MEAPACDPWNVLIPTPINGVCVHQCQKGEEAWVLPLTTVSCMRLEAMMPPLQATAHASRIVWRGTLTMYRILETKNI